MSWKYVGDGSWVSGVPHPAPGEDLILTDEEYAEYAREFKAREGVDLAKTGLYAKVADEAGTTKEAE